mmetsp:Transcript_4130/g.8919  ORF Transcript_4130/g.8919 Transcript_4130/m.8919 type:complete len:229 (+) Transcript_4130:502-1188(+)
MIIIVTIVTDVDVSRPRLMQYPNNFASPDRSLFWIDQSFVGYEQCHPAGFIVLVFTFTLLGASQIRPGRDKFEKRFLLVMERLLDPRIPGIFGCLPHVVNLALRFPMVIEPRRVGRNRIPQQNDCLGMVVVVVRIIIIIVVATVITTVRSTARGGKRRRSSGVVIVVVRGIILLPDSFSSVTLIFCTVREQNGSERQHRPMSFAGRSIRVETGSVLDGIILGVYGPSR